MTPQPKKGTTSISTSPPIFDLYAAAALQGFIQTTPPKTPEEIKQVAHKALQTAQTLLEIKTTHYAALP